MKNLRPLRLLQLVALGLILSIGPALARFFRVSEDQEIRVARSLEQEIRTKFRIFPAESAALGEMSRRLLGAGPWPKKFGDSFAFYVIEDPRQPKTLNAFAAPGGMIAFYKALYDKLHAKHGPDAVAAVLAHEIEHSANHHSARALENQMEKQLLFGIVLGATGAGDTIATLADLFVGLKALRYSRANENEADEKGIVRLWRAGYRTDAMSQVFEFLASQGGDKPPVYFSTHPADKTRIERARARHESLARRIPGEATGEARVFHRDGKAFVQAGWVDGLREGATVTAADGRQFKVARNLFLDHAELRARSRDLSEGSAVKLDQATLAAQPVSVGSVTEVASANNTIVVDLGRWQRITPELTFNIVQGRMEEVANSRGRGERTRVTRPVATARVRELRDREAVLEITSFTEAANDRFSMKDVQKGMEVRLAGWPN